MIDVYVQQGSGVAAWLVPALAALMGALVGGVASLLATGLANQHAVAMLRLQRREEAADALLGSLRQVINTRVERPGADKVLAAPIDRKAVLGQAYDLANRSAGDEPLVEKLCHEYGWEAGYECSWTEFRYWSAALSAALTQWRKDPQTFHLQRQSLREHLEGMPEEMRLRDEAKAKGAANPSLSPSGRTSGQDTA